MRPNILQAYDAKNRKTFVRSHVFQLGYAFMGLMLFFSCAKTPQNKADNSEKLSTVLQSPSIEAKNEFVLSAVGDVMNHQKVEKSANTYGKEENFFYSASLENLKSVFENSQLNFANLETPVAKKNYRKRRPFVFNAPPTILKSLSWMGFNLISVANNHSFDMGVRGLKDTLELHQELKIPAIGAGLSREASESGHCDQIQKIKYCSIAYTRVGGESWRKVLKEKGTWLNVNNSDDEMIEMVKVLKKKSDIVIVSIHWGDEYRVKPHPWQRKLAKSLYEAGAQIILGHHPHVLQEIEVFSNPNDKESFGIVAYSLGNFLSNQSAFFKHNTKDKNEARPRDSVILQLKVNSKGPVSLKTHALWTLNSVSPNAKIEVKRISQLLEENEIQKNGLIQKLPESETLKMDPKTLAKEKKILLQKEAEIANDKKLFESREKEIYKTLKIPNDIQDDTWTMLETLVSLTK